MLYDQIRRDDRFGENRNGGGENRYSPSGGRNDRNDNFQKRLGESLSSLFDISGSSAGRGSNSNGGMDTESFDDITIDFSSDEYRIQDDAPNLTNEDIYRNSDQYLNEDGSIKGNGQGRFDKDTKELLSRISNSAPEIPREMMGNAPVGNRQGRKDLNEIASNEQLLDYMKQVKNAKSNSLSPEELHSRIFANEEGFLEQSEIFKKSLSAKDKEEQDTANAWRRGADYRRRQQEAMSLIEKEMEEVERNSLSMKEVYNVAKEQNARKEKLNSSEPVTVICSMCGVLLSQKEIDIENKRGRTGIDEKVCRLCQVENLESKHGSPYLMGRVDRTGKAPPRLGISRDELYEQNENELRRIGPRTHYDDTEDTSLYASRSEGEKTAENVEAWRASFVSSAKTSLRPGEEIVPIVDKSRINYVERSDTYGSIPMARKQSSVQTDEFIANNDAAKNGGTSSNRMENLLRTKDQYRNDVWQCHYSAAKYRHQGTVGTKRIHHHPGSDIATPVNGSDTAALHAKIKELEGAVEKYKRDLEKSIQLTKAMQNIVNLKEKNRIVNPKALSDRKETTAGDARKTRMSPPTGATTEKSHKDVGSMPGQSAYKSKRPNDYPDVPF